MYAIVEDGARQYRAEEGKLLKLDHREVQAGDTLELTKVLLVAGDGAAKVGRPHVAGAKVVTEVVDFPKTKTVTQKFRRRKNYRRLKGHTQPHVRVKVKHILKDQV